MYVKMSDEVLKAKMSGNAKTLYALLLDKYQLSEKKGFLNASGQVICKMKQSEMAERLSCSTKTIQRTIAELKQKNLIKVELGLCKNYEIQVFQIGQNVLFKTDTLTDLKRTKCPIQNGQNVRSLTYKPDSLSQTDKTNARARELALGVGNLQSENSRISQNEQNENSRIPANEQNAKKTSKVKKEFLSVDDKPEFISDECWNDFVEYKKQRNERYTQIGKKKFLTHLANIQAKTARCEDALNESMRNNWQGVFEPKGKISRQAVKNATTAGLSSALLDWASQRQAEIAQCEEVEVLPSNERRAQ